MRRAFLNVERSLSGRRWVGPSDEQVRLSEALQQQTRLPEPVCRTLVRRNVAPEDANRFLAPQIKDLLPDPLSLRDMGSAAGRFLDAIRRNERIAVFADYDVDGGASAALVLTWLREMGRDATLYVPDRIEEGYGPNEPAMKALATEHDLIICVDCGTLSHGPIAAARGADVIVLDHHLGGETLPPAMAVVNPNRQDERGELSHLCAAGVVFLLLVEANRRLKAEGQAVPDLMEALDLVALATVADVAPLIGVNRAFVRRGLEVMARRRRPGFVALADVARLSEAPNAYHLGFLIGPRVNAGGRIGKADLGARCLATNDPDEARALAERLDQLNAERREIENQVRLAAMSQAETRPLDGPLVWAAGRDWHPGVVGIVAARLKEATQRPAVVIGIEDGIGKGSARSIPGVDLGMAVQRLVSEGFLAKGGGHRSAAGLTVEESRIEAAMTRLGELLATQGSGMSGPSELMVEGLVTPLAATPELVRALEGAGPFGQAAPAPRFALSALRVAHVREVGSGHLKITFADGSGGRLDAIAFGAAEGPIGSALIAHAGQRFHVAGHLELNRWGGQEKVQLRLEDAAAAEI